MAHNSFDDVESPVEEQLNADESSDDELSPEDRHRLELELAEEKKLERPSDDGNADANLDEPGGSQLRHEVY